MRRARESGFTLIELVVAMVLVAAMMSLVYSGLTYALKSWDAADAAGRRAADRVLAQGFLRREIMEMFPLRWKDPSAVKFAFEGDENRLHFVSSRPAGVALGGLSLVGVEVEDGARVRSRNLVMRRAVADPDAKDFAPLDAAERSILIEDVDSVSFSYYGAENDFAEPQWAPQWKYPGRMPEMVRMKVKLADGSALPDLVVKVVVAEEAGCLESPMQRLCRPRTS